MKSLVKLLLSIGIKLALIALLYAIAMGLSSCRGCSIAETSSFSSANNQEASESENSLVVNPSDASDSSNSLQANGTDPNSNIENKNTDVTINEEVANPTEQTRQDASNPGYVSNNPEDNNSDSAHAQATSTSAPTAAPAATSTPTPTSTPVPTSSPVPTATSTPEPTSEPTSIPEPTPTPKPVWGWANAKGTIKTTYDSASKGSNIPIEIPNMPVSGETCDGELTGYGKSTDATEEAVWNYLDNKFGEDFCGVGHLKVVDGSVHW